MSPSSNCSVSLSQHRIVSLCAATWLPGNEDEFSISHVPGGDINQCFKVQDCHQNSVFIKVNAQPDLLRSEYNSLQKIQSFAVEGYPSLLGFEVVDGTGLLALEFLELAPVTNHIAPEFAATLNNHHRVSQANFGWHQNGFIGLSPQINIWTKSWADFFTQYRLQPQLNLAINNGLTSKVVKQVAWLIDNFANLIDVNSITPGLVHGDLWLGNLAINVRSNCPVMYDPAPYFGDPEVDVAMTTLFGSLPIEFYRSYRVLNPEPRDLKHRHRAYNLYHALNHFNLFGDGYEALVHSLSRSY